MGIRTIIIDDEAPARERLRGLLEAHKDIEVIDEASDGIEAVAKIKSLQPQLVFLDIEMPGFNGFKVVQSLDPHFLPNIVFVTAFNQYAIEAFEIGAIDYLLKPVKQSRLNDSIHRAKSTMQEQRTAWIGASEVQKRLLPEKDETLGKIEVTGTCLAAHDVGGDYYDFIRLNDDRVGVCIADISGKGFAAALMMANLQASLKITAMTYGEPAAVVGKINQLFYENSVPEMFATLFYGVYDGAQERFTFCNAGHNPPLLLQGDSIRRLEQGGTVVGMFAGARYEEATVCLPPGSMVVGYSDGLTELTNQAGEEFGEERLIRVVREQQGLSAASLKRVILERARDFAPQETYHDDLTVVVLKVTG